MADPLGLTTPKTVLLSSPDMQDGSAWWRMLPPWNALREQCAHLGMLTLDLRQQGPSWTPIALSRVVVLNRPYASQHLMMVDTGNAVNVPSIVDYDDLVWEIPRWNPAHQNYGKHEFETAMIAATRARVVTTTTPFLREYLLSHIAPDADVRVIPNAIPDNYEWPRTARRKLVIYRGGDGHMGDLLPVADELVEAFKARPDWHLVTIGTDPWWLHERMPEGQSTHVPRQHLAIFHRWLRGSNAAVLIAPLRDCAFNRAKSSIVWLEGTYAGAAVLAPAALPEFERPGVTRYEPGEFGSRLGWLLDLPQPERDVLVRESEEWIDECARHRHVNVLRAAILRELLD